MIKDEAIVIDEKDIDRSVVALFPEIKDHIVDKKVQLKQAKQLILNISGSVYLKIMLGFPELINTLGKNAVPSGKASEAAKAVLKTWQDMRTKTTP